jgi:hypothetical protein
VERPETTRFAETSGNSVRHNLVLRSEIIRETQGGEAVVYRCRSLRVLLPALSNFLSSSLSGTGSTQLREDT